MSIRGNDEILRWVVGWVGRKKLAEDGVLVAPIRKTGALPKQKKKKKKNGFQRTKPVRLAFENN